MKNYSVLTCLILVIVVVLGCTVFESKSDDPLNSASPSKAYTEYVAAGQAKDTKKMQKLMTNASNRLAAKLAKERNMTIDQFLKAFQKPLDYDLKLRNEKIDGDSATLEEIHENKNWYAVVMIREDGTWKYAADKTQEERSRRLLSDR